MHIIFYYSTAPERFKEQFHSVSIQPSALAADHR